MHWLALDSALYINFSPAAESFMPNSFKRALLGQLLLLSVAAAANAAAVSALHGVPSAAADGCIKLAPLATAAAMALLLSLLLAPKGTPGAAFPRRHQLTPLLPKLATIFAIVAIADISICASSLPASLSGTV
jgi:hypothetical protein